MDAIQAARDLGKALQADPRYIEFMKAQDKNDADTALQESIGEFSLLRNQLNAEVQKPEKDTDKIKFMDKELKDMYQNIFDNPNMQEFSKARTEMEGLMNAINRIVSGSASGENPNTIPEEQEEGGSCGGDCGGCGGGCH